MRLHSHIKIRLFLSHPMTSNPRKIKAQSATVFSAVEGNPDLLDFLEVATTTARKIIFIDSLLKIESTAFFHAQKLKPEELFDLFTTWFGSFGGSETAFPGISAAIQQRKKYFTELRHHKREFIRDIGLDWTADVKSKFISEVNSLSALVGKSSFLPRLRSSMFQS